MKKKFKFKIEKREITYAIIGTLLIMAWFLIGKDFFNPILSTLPPIVSYLIYNTILFTGIYLLTFTLGDDVHLKASFIFFSISIGLILLVPPYFISTTGIVLKGADMWYLATDYVMSTVYSSFIPNVMITIPIIMKSYSIIWLLTYIFTPILFLLVIPILIAKPSVILKGLR